MPPVTGILDAIDGAVADYETGDDAVRWVPGHERRPAAVPYRPGAGEGGGWHDLRGAFVPAGGTDGNLTDVSPHEARGAGNAR
jgi:hypothetical protein